MWPSTLTSAVSAAMMIPFFPPFTHAWSSLLGIVMCARPDRNTTNLFSHHQPKVCSRPVADEVYVKKDGTNCAAGALCFPPSNLAGRAMRLAFDTAPSCCIAVPAMPASVAWTMGSVNCQHSIVLLPSDAEMAVTLKYLGVGADCKEAGEAIASLVARLRLIMVVMRLAMEGRMVAVVWPGAKFITQSITDCLSKPWLTSSVESVGSTG